MSLTKSSDKWQSLDSAMRDQAARNRTGTAIAIPDENADPRIYADFTRLRSFERKARGISFLPVNLRDLS